MAYGLKYQSIFYNIFGTKVEVLIYKRDYVGSVIDVRTQEVTVEVNYQDEDTPIIGTGAKVTIIANTSQMTQYEDLLTSLEKEFECIIVYGGPESEDPEEIVFDGFSMCDLNERQFLPYASITIQFTDYLRRLESVYLDCVKLAGKTSSLLDILSEAIGAIATNETLFINSSLFEDSMDKGSTDEFVSQTILNNYIFHTSETEVENAYSTINKALMSFGAYLYSFKGQWYLERQEDVLSSGAWLRTIALGSGFEMNTFANQKQSLNKQNDDFKYIERSQVLEYESGLKKLILQLQDKQYDTLVFNDYSLTNMISINTFFPAVGTIDIGQWYYHQNALMKAVGHNYRHIETYLKWMYPVGSSVDYMEFAGITNAFEVNFTPSPEEPIMLNISYKQSAGETPLPVTNGDSTWYARLRFMLLFDGGYLDGWYLKQDATTSQVGLVSPARIGAISLSNEILVPLDKNSKPVFDADLSINLSDVISILGLADSWSEPTNISIWQALNYPTTQKIIITILPLAFYVVHPTEALFDPGYENVHPCTTQYFGDLSITESQQPLPNKLTYYINKEFENTKELSMDVFDISNEVFANGPMRDDGTGHLVRTEKWVSVLNATPVCLMDIFAKNKFQNYARTIHRLKGTILYDGAIKPFAVITDNNLVVTDASAADYGQTISLIVQSYTWDLNNGTFNIDAQEYTDDDLGFDVSQDEGTGGVTSLSAPTNLDAVQNTPAEGFDVTWDAVTGAGSYVIQRRPYYDPMTDAWVDQWKTVGQVFGTTTFYDAIQLEATPSHGQSFFYQVAAKTVLLNGPYCTSLHVFWAAY